MGAAIAQALAFVPGCWVLRPPPPRPQLSNRLSACAPSLPPQRVLLLDYNKESGRISMRHYSIAVAPSGVRWAPRDAGLGAAVGRGAAPAAAWPALPSTGAWGPSLSTQATCTPAPPPPPPTPPPTPPQPPCPLCSKNLKHLLARKDLPDMGRMADVAEFLTRSGYGSVRAWRQRQRQCLLTAAALI